MKVRTEAEVASLLRRALAVVGIDARHVIEVKHYVLFDPGFMRIMVIPKGHLNVGKHECQLHKMRENMVSATLCLDLGTAEHCVALCVQTYVRQLIDQELSK